MSSRRTALIVLPLAIGAMVFWIERGVFLAPGGHDEPSRTRPAAPAANASSTAQAGIESNPASNSSADSLAAKAGMRAPPPPAVTNLPALVLLQNARHAITEYARVYGGNPVGTNPEITAALAGHNPKHINFIAPDSGLQVSAQGEMVDSWGTPLFFHQISGHDMEIHSAGEDRVMWTYDDVVVK